MQTSHIDMGGIKSQVSNCELESHAAIALTALHGWQLVHFHSAVTKKY